MPAGSGVVVQPTSSRSPPKMISPFRRWRPYRWRVTRRPCADRQIRRRLRRDRTCQECADCAERDRLEDARRHRRGRPHLATHRDDRNLETEHRAERAAPGAGGQHERAGGDRAARRVGDRIPRRIAARARVTSWWVSTRAPRRSASVANARVAFCGSACERRGEYIAPSSDGAKPGSIVRASRVVSSSTWWPRSRRVFTCSRTNSYCSGVWIACRAPERRNSTSSPRSTAEPPRRSRRCRP